jgi:hypothetical protein
VQADESAQGFVGHPLAGPHRRKTQLCVDGAALGALEFDLESCALGRRRVVEQLRELDAEPRGDRTEQREPRLAAAVLHEGELTAGDADIRSQLFEGESRGRAEMPHPLPQSRQILHDRLTSRTI